MALTGNWNGAQRGLNQMAQSVRWQRAFDVAANKEAERIRAILVKSFNAGGPTSNKWRPLSTFTQLVSRAEGKGDRRPLSRNGDLKSSIQVVHKGDIWFVGVQRGARNREGDDLVNIALIHEEGTRRYTVEVTDKMRKYFMWLHFATDGQISPLSSRTTHISVKIPARALFGPVWAEEEEDSIDNIRKDIVQSLAVTSAFGARR